MRDPRLMRLAQTLVEYSVDLQPGEQVWIDAIDIPNQLVQVLVDEVYKRKGIPYVNLVDTRIARIQLQSGSVELFRKMAQLDRMKMEQMQAYIGIRGGENTFELSGIDSDLMKQYQSEYNQQVHSEVRVKKTKWVILRYPSASMAQSANQSTERFEDYFFDVCTLNYKRFAEAMQPLHDLMQKTNQVHIVGPGTDLTFSIQNIGAVMCCGRRNLPDGEVYSAPIKESVNGMLSVNTSSTYQGYRFENIRFRFENGKIIEATANDTERLNKILNSDDGARYIGEFSLGLNPFILHPMNDTLFDEKIAGSFHFTPGQCYDRAYNGNHSAIHWDLVTIQRPEYGGGQIWFDGRLIRQDGLFVADELLQLNPDRLLEEGDEAR